MSPSIANGGGEPAPASAATLAPSASLPKGRKVLLIGGTSEIGLAIVRQLAAKGALEVALLGRDDAALEQAADALRAAGVRAAHVDPRLDAQEPAGHRELIDRAIESLGGVDIAILAVGLLGQRGGLPDDVPAALHVLDVNVRGCGSLLMHSAAAMREAGGGILIVLSSAAAVRPRRSNAVYCASKAAIDSLAQGLGDALAPDGVDVVVVRPGFVRTAMTAGLREPSLSCDPIDVAKATVDALERGGEVVWAPAAMRWAMAVVRLMPRRFLRRLSI